MRVLAGVVLVALGFGHGGAPANWVGAWVARTGGNQQEIDIGRRGALVRVAGIDVWYDRSFAASGIVPVGTFSATVRPSATDRMTILPPDMPGCALHLHLAGSWMFVRDNERCGGINVSFTGTYRRTKKEWR